MRRSRFERPVTVAAWEFGTFERNLALEGVKVDRNPRSTKLMNNTITNPEGDGMTLEVFRGVELRNNIIAFCRRGVVNEHWKTPTLEYNDVYGCEEEDYVECEAGEGSISADPRFADLQNGDYHLMWNSPCIDAGDPWSPHDPDGTRADMGAFYTDVLSAPGEGVGSQPSGFGLSVYPNPFNSTAVVSCRLSVDGWVKVGLYDLNGRLVQTLAEGWMEAGQHSLLLDGDGFSSGVYIIRGEAGREAAVGVARLVR